MNKIQVCWYIGEWPKHEELENEFLPTKREALQYLKKIRTRHQAKGEYYNYRIVDWLNRFPPMFFEKGNCNYTHKCIKEGII